MVKKLIFCAPFATRLSWWCHAALCECKNGIGAKFVFRGSEGGCGPHHSPILCALCMEGFHKTEEGRCERNKCVCPNGVAKEGMDCAVHNSLDCVEGLCKRGYFLLGGDTKSGCVPMICTCVGGTPSSPCLDDGAEDCAVCDEGNHLTKPPCLDRFPRKDELAMVNWKVPMGPLRHGLRLGIVFRVVKKLGCAEVFVIKDKKETRKEKKILVGLGLNDTFAAWEIKDSMPAVVTLGPFPDTLFMRMPTKSGRKSMMVQIMEENFSNSMGLILAGGLDIRFGDTKVSSALQGAGRTSKEDLVAYARKRKLEEWRKDMAKKIDTLEEDDPLQAKTSVLAIGDAPLQFGPHHHLGELNTTNETSSTENVNPVCRMNKCLCDHGEAAIGKECPEHGTKYCSAPCDFGYTLQDGDCKPMVIAINSGQCDEIVIVNPTSQPPQKIWRDMLTLSPEVKALNQTSPQHVKPQLKIKPRDLGFYRVTYDFIRNADLCKEAGARLRYPSGGPQTKIKTFRSDYFPNNIRNDPNWGAKILASRPSWQQVIRRARRRTVFWGAQKFCGTYGEGNAKWVLFNHRAAGARDSKAAKKRVLIQQRASPDWMQICIAKSVEFAHRPFEVHLARDKG